MNKYLTYFIAFISGLVGVFAFSPFDYWPLAYVSLLGLLYVAKNPKNPPHFYPLSCGRWDFSALE